MIERPHLIGSRTPWGKTQEAVEYAPGIVFHTTAGHGGFHLDRARVAEVTKRMPCWMPWTGSRSWYEEDCDWAVVVLMFPDAFSPDQHRMARQCLEGAAKTDTQGRYKYAASKLIATEVTCG